MKKYFQMTGLVFTLFILFCPATSTISFAAADNDTIIAIVNKEVITLKDLHDYLSAIYLQLSAEGKSPKELQEIMKDYETKGIQRLIDDKLLVDAANKKEITIRDKAIDDKIIEIKKSYPSEDVFTKNMNAEGLTISDLKKRISDQLKSRYVTESEIRSKIFVKPSDVTKFYEDHVTDFKRPERADLDSIFISNTPTPDNKDGGNPEKISQEAFAAIKSGKDFLEVARQYSQTPSIGTVERGQMLSEIETVIFNLKTGDVSQSIKTEKGMFIFKLKKILPAETFSIDEAKDKIYNFLANQEFQKRMHAWIEELRKKAYIEIKE